MCVMPSFAKKGKYWRIIFSTAEMLRMNHKCDLRRLGDTVCDNTTPPPSSIVDTNNWSINMEQQLMSLIPDKQQFFCASRLPVILRCHRTSKLATCSNGWNLISLLQGKTDFFNFEELVGCWSKMWCLFKASKVPN